MYTLYVLVVLTIFIILGVIRLKRVTVKFFYIISNIISRQVLNGSHTEGHIIGDFNAVLILGDFGGHLR